MGGIIRDQLDRTFVCEFNTRSNLSERRRKRKKKKQKDRHKLLLNLRKNAFVKRLPENIRDILYTYLSRYHKEWEDYGCLEFRRRFHVDVHGDRNIHGKTVIVRRLKRNKNPVHIFTGIKGTTGNGKGVCMHMQAKVHL